MAAIEIPDTLRAELYGLARAAYPHECCGYLVGPHETAVTAVVPCRNAQTEGGHPTHPERGAETGFVIAGSELLAFARSFDGPLPARVVYHSHTNGRAYFSAIDQVNALTPRVDASSPAGPVYPVQHLVIGVTDQGVTEAAQFAWSTVDGAFVEVARWDARC
jgi:[CysO sulfur-carrier protein]-S-L-cysteine hydrolase